ncbi:hypothetical protein [Agaribacterium haliotis]|uniref:hypothetical protein n=1 Tax=Agaribacterium haliotis TaxID=2013869 RepID=UPI000BB5336F|nr:hypothetical protein [Agaribacterium haliotis]
MKTVFDTLICTLFMIVCLRSLGDVSPYFNWSQGPIWLCAPALAWVFYGRNAMKIEQAFISAALALGLTWLIQNQGPRNVSIGSALAFSKLILAGLFVVSFLIMQRFKLK